MNNMGGVLPSLEMLRSAIEERTRGVFDHLLENANELSKHLEGINGLGPSVVQHALEAPIADALSENEQYIGMGFVGILQGELYDPDGLTWWVKQGGIVRPKQHVMNPKSDSYYDYNTSQWFSTTQDSRSPFISAPYVDAWGTDQLTITGAAPVIAKGEFVGVIAVDVAPEKFLARLSRLLLNHERISVTDAENRVIVSSIPTLSLGQSLELYESHHGLTAGPGLCEELSKWNVSTSIPSLLNSSW